MNPTDDSAEAASLDRNEAEKEGTSSAGETEVSNPVSDEAPRDENEKSDPRDPVETALAYALTEATRYQRWAEVAQLARELQARRMARTSNVLVLDPSKRVKR